MKLYKEIKVSDRNYGNRTTSIEVEVKPDRFVEAHILLDKWADLMKIRVNVSDDDEITVKEARELELARNHLASILEQISTLGE